MTIRIHHSPERMQFEYIEESKTAYVRYAVNDGVLELRSTQVPSELEGQGIGSALNQAAFDYALAQQLPVRAICPFSAAYAKRHPERAQQLVN